MYVQYVCVCVCVNMCWDIYKYKIFALALIQVHVCARLCVLTCVSLAPWRQSTNNPGCPYIVGRQCGACGVLALYH